MYIRNVTEADLEIIVDIYNQSIPQRQATADLEPISVESRLAWSRDRAAYHPLWVAEIDNLITGWLSLQPFYGRPAYRHTAEVSIYVATAYHRQGIGSSLLQQAIEFCPQVEINTLLAFIFGHNHASLQLFKNYDFIEWGNLPRVAKLDEMERDLIILGLRID